MSKLSKLDTAGKVVAIAAVLYGVAVMDQTRRQAKHSQRHLDEFVQRLRDRIEASEIDRTEFGS